MKWRVILAMAPLLSGVLGGICCEDNQVDDMGCACGVGGYCVNKSLFYNPTLGLTYRSPSLVLL